MKKTSLVLLLFCLCMGVQAQQIAKYEYWFDQDSDQRKSVSVANGSIILNVHAVTLPLGIHTFHFRALDSEGRWSSPLSSLFIRQPMTQEGLVIDKYEYWFDEDYNNRISGHPTGEWIELAANAKTLTTGIHSFQFRARDYAGRWSSPIVSYFMRVPSAQEGLRVKSYEYWFDDDYKHRVTAHPSGDLINLSLDVKHLSVGVHSFQFRAIDDAGRRSAPVVGYFLRVALPSEVSTTFNYEYWFDNDESQKMTGSTTNGIISLQADAGNLKGGLHSIAFCIRGEDGRWAPPVYQYFVKPYDNVKNRVAGYYYWYNDLIEDAQLVRLEQPASPLLLNVNLPTNNLAQEVTRENITILNTADGQQKLAMKNVLSMKFLDERGRWSAVQVDTFAVAVGNRVVSLTPFIVNPEADEQWKGWTTQGNRNIANADDHYSGKAGNYFRLRNGEMRQTISGLPAGTYMLSAMGRVPATGKLSLNVGGYSADFANTAENNGWSQHTVMFVTDGSSFDIVATAAGIEGGQWADVDGFELTVNGIVDKANTVNLNDVQIVSIDNVGQWNELGSPVKLNVSGFYQNKKGRNATIYYSVDNGTAIKLMDDVRSGDKFAKQIECFFRENASPHTISFYGRDSENVTSERFVIEIGSMNRGCTVENLPQTAIYTGEPIVIDSLTVRDNRTGQLLSPDDYTVTYINNVDDGVATIAIEGVYPNYLGRKEVRFTIKSYIDNAEMAVLRSLYEQTLGDSLWYRKWDVQKEQVLCDELTGITARNRHVTAINLANNYLTGEIPAGLLTLPALQTIQLENNNLKGIVNTKDIAASVRELYLANNHLWGLNDVIPATVERLSLSGQTIDEVATLHLSVSDIEQQLQQLPNIGLYDHRQQNFSRNATITIRENSYNDPTLAVLSQRDGEWQLRKDEWGSRTYMKVSGDTVYCRDDAQNRFMIKLEYDAGDANFDGMVNIQDLSTTIMYCLKNYFATFNYGAANLWQDEIINIQDAVCLVNILLDATPPHANVSSHTKASRRSTPDGLSAIITYNDGRLTLSSPVPISAFDILISNTQLSEIASLLESQGFLISMRQQSDGVHLIGYSPSGSLLSAGNTTIAEVKSRHPRVRAALLADDKARAVIVMGSETDGISEVANSSIGVVLGKSMITVTSAEALNNVSWTLQGVNGTIFDSGHVKSLPAGVNSMACKPIRHGVYVLRLTADGQRPIVKKISMR